MELQIGAALPTLTRTIAQENINLYAHAARDFNPIHINPEFAQTTPMGGTIAHGMLVLAYISQMLTEAFGNDWLTAGRVDIRFREAARPDDTITVTGTIKKIQSEASETIATCGVQCANQHGSVVISGDAIVRVKK